MVAGVVHADDRRERERAALGAGAIVMDVIAVNDGRRPHEKIQRIRAAAARHDPARRAAPTAARQARRRDGRADRRRRSAGRASAPATSCRSSTRATTRRAPIVQKMPRRQDRADRRRQPAARARAREPAARRATPSTSFHGARHGARARLRQAHDVDRRADHADAGRGGPASSRRSPSETGINVVGVDIGGATTDVFSVFDGIFNRTVSRQPRDELLGVERAGRGGHAEHPALGPFAIDEARAAQPDQEQDDPPDDDSRRRSRSCVIEQAICARGAAAGVRCSTRSSRVGLKGVQQRAHDRRHVQPGGGGRDARRHA